MSSSFSIQSDALHTSSKVDLNQTSCIEFESTRHLIRNFTTVSTRLQAQQRESNGEQIQRISAPTPEQFKEEFFDRQEAVVIVDALKEWPALSKWKDKEYLKKLAPDEIVPVEIGESYMDPTISHASLRFADFINYLEACERLQTEPVNSIQRKEEKTNQDLVKMYLAQHALFNQIPQLGQDVITPSYVGLGRGDSYGTNAWFGPAGTVSPLHKDPYHNCFAQVVGSKYIRLYHSKDSIFLYPYMATQMNTSRVDVGNPDLEKYPLFGEAPYKETVLNAGELLYIPLAHWHYVKSLSVSFSVSWWWQ